MAAPSIGWSQVLMGFGWLRHLRAADTALARANARALVDDWMIFSRGRTGPAWEPNVVSRRLMSWLCQSPMILDDADWPFYRRFMKSIGQQAAFLESALHGAVEGEARLTAAVAIAATGLCAEGLIGLQKRGTRALRGELRRQILADGGHVSRNPRAVHDLLLDLLPLRQAYVARGVEAPEELVSAIDRMMSMLRLFRHADGALALFNGMGVTAPDTLATLLAYDDARGAPLLDAPQSGYQRLEANGTIVILDAGAPPPREFSAEAQAGCLSFEVSAGYQRIIVNCGAPTSGARADVRAAARSTIAQSTLSIEQTSSCRFATTQRLRAWVQSPLLSGPRQVPCKRTKDDTEEALLASHDGYAEAFGLVHEREVRLTSDGMRIEGEDRLRPATSASQEKPHDYAVRFHLHPSVVPQMLAEERGVELVLPNGEVWTLDATGGLTELEEGIFFAAPDRARRTHQIVIRARFPGTQRIAWTLSKRTIEAVLPSVEHFSLGESSPF
jgi:uncharacterized heparinase superfamily protein